MSGNPSTSPTVTPMPATAAFGVLLAVARSIARVSEIKSTLANAIRANTYSLVLHLRYVRREPHRRKREKQDAGERGYSFVFSALDVEPLFFLHNMVTVKTFCRYVLFTTPYRCGPRYPDTTFSFIEG